MISFLNWNELDTTTASVILFVMFTLTATSCLLNPVMFKYNYKKDSIPGRLFTILSVVDFISCPIAMSAVLILASTESVNVLETPDFREFRNATMVNKIVGLINCNLNFGPNCIVTSVFMIVRFYQIIYPLRNVQFKHVKYSIAALIFVFEGLLLFTFISPHSNIKFNNIGLYSQIWGNPFGLKPNTILSQSLIGLCTSFLGFILQLIGIILTIILVLYILRQALSTESVLNAQQGIANVRNNRLKSCVKIFLINFFSVLCIVFMLVSSNYFKEIQTKNYHSWINWLIYIIYKVFPMVNCVWDPAIFILLTPKSRN